MNQKYLTSFSDHQRHQVCLVLGQNSRELFKAGNTSPREQLHQLVVAVTWFSAEKVVSLTARDAADCTAGQRSDKVIASINQIQQMDAVH